MFVKSTKSGNDASQITNNFLQWGADTSASTTTSKINDKVTELWVWQWLD